VNPYIDPDTGAFYNKLGIKDPDELHQVEYAVTDLRIAELLVKPIPGKFDLEHLKANAIRLIPTGSRHSRLQPASTMSPMSSRQSCSMPAISRA